jgi:hypothetical protein
MKYIVKYSSSEPNIIVTSFSTQEDTYELQTNEIDVNKKVYCVIQDLFSEGVILLKNVTSTIKELKNISLLKSDKDTPYNLYLAPFNDRAGVRYLTGYRIISSYEFWDSELFVLVSKQIYEMLKEKEVDIAVNKITCSIKDLCLIDENEVVVIDSTTTSLEGIKILLKNRAFLLTKTRLDDTMYFAFFNFTLNNNKLAAAGFIVTDENREDKYLEIVNKNDADLLDSLSIYLESLDTLKIYNKYYLLYKNFITKLDEQTDVDSANKVFDEFNSEFM